MACKRSGVQFPSAPRTQSQVTVVQQQHNLNLEHALGMVDQLSFSLLFKVRCKVTVERCDQLRQHPLVSM